MSAPTIKLNRNIHMVPKMSPKEYADLKRECILNAYNELDWPERKKVNLLVRELRSKVGHKLSVTGAIELLGALSMPIRDEKK